MDVNNQTCTSQRRPRCAAGVPRLQKLVADGRAKGMTVIYTLSGTTTAADILKEIAPAPGEAVLPSFGPDKFMGNDLEKILKEKGIKTVITVGTAAHTSVLHSASGAALRGYNVVVPVDVISSDSPYQEQYTVAHLGTANRIVDKVALTTTAMMKP
jgi:nicotinamidase-related amidase